MQYDKRRRGRVKRVLVKRHLRCGRPVRAHFMVLSRGEFAAEMAAARRFGEVDKSRERPMKKIAKELLHTYGQPDSNMSEEQRDKVLDAYGESYDES